MTAPLETGASSQNRQSQPGAWPAFWQTTFRFQADKVTPWLALRNTLGVVLPLAAGVALGAVSTGLVISTGALNVSFSDSHEPYVQRGRRMLIASLLVGIAVFAGSVSGRSHAAAVTLTAAWAFAAGLAVALSTVAADLGAISLVTLVVYAAFPMTVGKALASGLLALTGGLLQTLLALVLWPLRRYDPERRALGDLFVELARTVHSPVQASQTPAASSQSTEAHLAFAALERDRSVEGERLRLLLSQAERMRLSLLTLMRLRIRLQRENSAGPEGEMLDRYCEIFSRMLSSVGHSLLAGQRLGVKTDGLQEVETLADSLRDQNAAGSPVAGRTFYEALRRDAVFQMDALSGQLRTVLELTAHTTPAGLADFKRRESARPWTLRFAGTLATLRANLTLKSSACRHAIRLAVCVAAGDAVARGFGLRRSYWLPMTIAIVLKPDFTATFTRGVLRLAGTLVGLVFATALFHLLAPTKVAQVAVIAVLMFVLRCFGSANYGILVSAITALVVLLLALTGVAPNHVIAARGLNTVDGGAIALLAYWLWPTWERTQISETVAGMLDAYRLYFRAIREGYLHPDSPFTHELDRARVAARLARSNLEASFDRFGAEPGASTDRVSLLSGMLASSHRLVHAIMALESGLHTSHPAARDAFRPFANHVELTLYYLAAALRGSPLTLDALPDLRKDHHALVHSGDSPVARYEFVNVETDRITNSLNTLSEEVLRWIGGRPGV